MLLRDFGCPTCQIAWEGDMKDPEDHKCPECGETCEPIWNNSAPGISYAGGLLNGSLRPDREFTSMLDHKLSKFHQDNHNPLYTGGRRGGKKITPWGGIL